MMCVESLPVFVIPVIMIPVGLFMALPAVRTVIFYSFLPHYDSRTNVVVLKNCEMSI